MEKVEISKEVAAIMVEEHIQEESLSREHEEALQLYKRHEPRIDIVSAKVVLSKKILWTSQQGE